MSRRLFHKIFILLLFGGCFIFSWPIGDRHRLKATTLTQSDKVKQELSSFFKSYDLIRLDTPAVLEGVRQSGRFDLRTANGVVEVVLSPHDLRGHDYRTTTVAADGHRRPIAAADALTFKGIVDGNPQTQARFTIRDDLVEGLIIKDGKQYYLEPAIRFSTSADPGTFVLYNVADVIYDASESCGVSLGEKVATAKTGIGVNSQTTVSSFRTIELATEADYEYVSAVGGPANAINDILSIMNQVEGVYENELGLTFEIVYQNAWETSADPYSSTSDSVQLLEEFRNYWNTNFTSVGRDVAHMWTGRNMGGVLGRGYQSVACSAPTLAYGLSRLDDRLPLKYVTPAHEIAHSIGATHADANPECVGSIMRPTTTTTFSFCQFSRNEIANYVQQSGFCLSQPGSSPVVSGHVADVSGKPISNVSIQAIGSTFKIVQTDANGVYVMKDLLAGGSYQITPVKQGYAFTPQNVEVYGLVGNYAIDFTLKNSPDGPVLVTVGTSNEALALDSVTLRGGPFPGFTQHNFSADGRTRLVFFAYNAALLPGEDISTVKAEAENASGKYALTVESLQPLPTLNWLSQITIVLPAELDDAGDVLVNITVRGVKSNKVSVRIASIANDSAWFGRIK